MGNCCERCFGRLDKRKYLRTRYNVERDFSIEFENLMDDEPQQEELPNRVQVVTSRERLCVTEKNYGALIAEQKVVDREIDKKLVRQEEELRMEEEAYYEAKREAARVAKMQKNKEKATKESSALVVKNGPKAWLGDDESDWDVSDPKRDSLNKIPMSGLTFLVFFGEPRIMPTVCCGAGGEDDFEMFLESVKARSLAARTRALPSQVPFDAASETSSKDDRSRTEASSLDLEWEHEAGMQPLPKERKRKFIMEENITELTVKPMLMLRNKTDSFDYEWDNGFEANNDSDIEESQKLLSKRKHTQVEVDR